MLIRTPAPADVPRLLYCWASDPQPTSHWTDGDDVLTTWANSVDEITRSSEMSPSARDVAGVHGRVPHVDRHAGRIYDLVRRDAEPPGGA